MTTKGMRYLKVFALLSAVCSLALWLTPQISSAAPRILRFGTIYADDTPTGMAALKFGKLVKEKTNGEILVNHFPSEQLGNEQEMLESVGMGAIDFTAPSCSMSGLFEKQFLIFSLCYLIDDWEHLARVMESDLGQGFRDKFLANTGGRMLCSNWFLGPRHLVSTKPVHKLADLTGLRIRVAENPAWLRAWQRLGANTTPMALSEVYSGIQTGALDGAEFTLTYYVSTGYYVIAPNFMLTGHIIDTRHCVVNDALFQSLSPAHQQAITEAAFEAGDAHQQYVLESTEKELQKVRDNGGTIIEVDRENWIAKMDGLGEEIWEIWGDKDLYQKVRAFASTGK